MEQDLDEWSGRRYLLSYGLQGHWSDFTQLKTSCQPLTDKDLSNSVGQTTCYKFGTCVCGQAEKVTKKHDALNLHENFVRLFRPYIILKPLPKKRSQQPSKPVPAEDAPQKVPTVAESKEARKSRVRKFLDKGFLVARFHLPADVRDLLFADLSDKQDSWCAAAYNIFRGNGPIHDEVWFHMSYANLQTWMFTFLRLERLSGAVQDSEGKQVIRLKVPAEPGVYTTVEAFKATLHFPTTWDVSWYAIDSSNKAIDDEFVFPDTVDVSLLPDSEIPVLRVWQGSCAEAAERDRLERMARKRKAESSQGGRGHNAKAKAKGKASAQGRQPQKPGQSSAGADHGGGVDANTQDEFAESQWPSAAEHAASKGAGEGSEHESIAEDDLGAFFDEFGFPLEAGPPETDQELMRRLENELNLWQQPEPPEPASSSWEGQPAGQPAPSSSVSASAEAAPPLEPPPATTPAEPSAASTKVTKEVKVVKKKEVREDVIWIEHDGVQYGSLRYNAKAKTITAHCEAAAHNQGGDSKCRKERTVAPSERAQAKGKTGRPIGFLVFWLMQSCKFKNCQAHVHELQFATRDEREEARRIFNQIEGAEAFSVKAEKACAAGEPAEPILFA